MEELGGVGDVGGKVFMWLIDENVITVSLDSGESFEFENDREGWYSFLIGVLMITGQI